MPLWGKGHKPDKSGLVLPDFQTPAANIASKALGALLGESLGKLLDLSAKNATGIIWRFPIKTSEDPTVWELIAFDYDDIPAATSYLVTDTLAGGVANYTSIGALVFLWASKTSDNSDLGHIIGAIKMSGATLYASTVVTEASSGGTTSPHFRLASDGYEVGAHASFATRISGLLVIIYA